MSTHLASTREFQSTRSPLLPGEGKLLQLLIFQASKTTFTTLFFTGLTRKPTTCFFTRLKQANLVYSQALQLKLETFNQKKTEISHQFLKQIATQKLRGVRTRK